MRDSLLNLLHGRPAEEIVWTADITYWIEGQRHRGGMHCWDSEEQYLNLSRELGILPYYWYDKFWLFEPEYEGVEVIARQEGPRRSQKWHAANGELYTESEYLSQSCSEACTRYPVNNEQDLRLFVDIMERRRLVPANLTDYSQRLALWAKFDGLPSVALPRSPLSAFFYEWAGVQNGTYLLYDCPDLISRALYLMEQQEQPILDAVAAAGVPLVHFADNLSTENFSGLFEQWMRERYIRRIERLHAAGVACAVHLDGTVRGLLPKLAEVGFDAIEALTPHPVGDVAVEELRPLANNRQVVLWGGLPGAMFAPPFTWQDMKSHLERLLETWRGTRFVIGVGDQVPPDGDIEMCRRIADHIRDVRTLE